MSEQPVALHLRLLQTVVAVAAEKDSTLIQPFPVELLRFLERAGEHHQNQIPQPSRPATTRGTGSPAGGESVVSAQPSLAGASEAVAS